MKIINKGVLRLPPWSLLNFCNSTNYSYRSILPPIQLFIAEWQDIVFKLFPVINFIITAIQICHHFLLMYVRQNVVCHRHHKFILLSHDRKCLNSDIYKGMILQTPALNVKWIFYKKLHNMIHRFTIIWNFYHKGLGQLSGRILY